MNNKLLALIKRLYRWFVKRSIKITEPSSTDFVDVLIIDDVRFGELAWRTRRLFKMDNSTVLVAKQFLDVVGYIVTSEDEKGFHIRRLAVQTGYDGLGIATMMLDHVSKSRARVTLRVNETNASAIGLYTKLGFRVLSRQSNYYKNNEAALLMVKENDQHST